MPRILIGIDDTDMPDTPGTGKLARRLTQELTARGARFLAMTAHQFLIDDRIPYTGHNRGICVAIDWQSPLDHLHFTFDLIRDWAAVGSDPGVCIAAADSVPAAVTDFGRSVMRTVRTMEEAVSLARTQSLLLQPLGGTGQGIVGALASVGLHAGGEEGRVVDLPGLRDIGEFASADQLAALGIQIDHQFPESTADSKTLATPPDSYKMAYNTQGWIRPTLRQGKPVWSVQWSNEHDAWISLDRRKSVPLD